MEDNKKEQEVAQEEVTPEQQIKDLMNKIKSAITVYTHKHDGKAPESIEEIAQMLEQEQEPLEQSEEEPEDGSPKVLSYLIHYGKDPSKPAFYEDTKSALYFDPKHGSWSDSKPELLDHLQSREVESEDLFDMILHGVMDDSDYSSLNELGMVDQKCCQLYDKIQSLKSVTSELEKSEENPEEEIHETEISESSEEVQIPSEPEEEVAGFDVASEIMYWAQAPANNRELEGTVRGIVEKILAEKGL